MKTQKELFYGCAYYDEYMPYDRLEEDFKMMERAGMNTIRIAESTWSTLEPQEHVYDFTALDRMLAGAEKYHFNVIIGTPTYAIPTWLVKKEPEILGWTHSGRSLYGHRQNMDITHPTYLKYAENIIRVLISHVAKHPNVIGYQIDNETKPYDTCSTYAQTRFVEYCKEKWPSLEDFNHEFGLDYWSNRINSWEDFPDIRGTINGSLAAEYEKFQRSLVTEFFAWQRGIIEEYKREDQFITHNFDFDWHNYSYGFQPDCEQFETATQVDTVGADIYHPSGAHLTGAEINVCGAISYGLKKKNFYVLETEAQGNLGWLPYPGQLRLQAYHHLANGANGVMYWHWHSIHNSLESYWKGVLSHDLKENATYRDCMSIGNEWKAIGDHLLQLKKENNVAILVNNESFTGEKYFPAAPAGTTGDTSFNTFLRYIADALYHLNVEYDIVHADDADLEKYKLVIAPSLYSVKASSLLQLKEYVKNGGTLLATMRSFFSNEHLKIYAESQPALMTDCFGMHYDQFTIPYDVDVRIGDTQVPASTWMELLIPDTAEILATYENPYYKDYAAATVNSYGDGKAYYFGSYSEDLSFAEALMKKICEDSRINLPQETYPLVVKQGTNQFGKKIHYYLNYSGQEQTVTLPFDARELTSQKTYKKGDSIRISPWNLQIFEL